MPNWCFNTLKIKGNKNLRSEFKHMMDSFIKGKFEKVAKDAESVGHVAPIPTFDFEFVLPLPEELRDTTSPRPVNKDQVLKWAKENNWADDVLQARLASCPTDEENVQLDALRDKYGFDNWYDWCNSIWGTKWNACNSEGSEVKETAQMLVYYFETAWCPPVGVIHALASKFPDLKFRLEYSVEGESGIEVIEGSAAVWEKYSSQSKADFARAIEAYRKI